MDEKEHKSKDRNALKEEYNKLKEKYNLPEYELLNKNFEIDQISPEENILREILQEMHSTIDFYSRLLEGLIQPDSKLCDMKEAESMTKEDQAKIMSIYRKCMLLNRTLLITNLDYEEAEVSRVLTSTNKEWQELKKELRIIITKMKETWEQETKTKDYGGYYG